MNRVYNLMYNGKVVANHIVIVEGSKETLKSYDSIVCEISPGGIKFGKDYKFSKTTLKYVNEFLRQHGLPKAGKAEVISL